MIRQLLYLTVVLSIAVPASAARAQKPDPEARKKDLLRRLPYGAQPLARLPSPLPALIEVAESEPNNSPAEADPVAIGDQGTGVISPAADVDFWSFSAGENAILDIDVDAAQVGSALDPVLFLLNATGETILGANDDTDGLDSRIRYTVGTGGTHLLAIIEFNEDEGGAGYTYTINFNTAAPGSGDPVAHAASDLGGPIGVTAGPTGDTYISDPFEGRVLRMDPQGSVTTHGVMDEPYGVAVDIFGHVLAASPATGSVDRFTPGGSRSTFIPDVQTPFWVAVGPDGEIWVSDLADSTIRRYDIHGSFEESFDVSAVGAPGPLALSAAGDVYFTTGPDIYRLENGTPQLVVTTSGFIWGFTIDADGNFYVPDQVTRRIALYDASGSLIEDPFVNGLQQPLGLGFGRFSNGAPNSILFATDFENGLVVRVNGNGVLAGGPDIVPFLAFIPFDDVLDELLLDSGSLPAEDLDQLDAAGNGNGGFDTGDFRAYVGADGVVPQPAVSVVAAGKGGQR